MDWAEFWGGAHRIYVNRRHLDAHYERLAADMRRLLAGRRLVVLDYGCGDALAAPVVAAQSTRLLLYDAAPPVRARAAARFAGVAGLQVLEPADWDALPPESLDLALVNSVAQYLARAELEALLDRLRRLLKPSGELILADVIPPESGAFDDVAALLGAAARHGFLIAALGGLAATFFSDYRRLRRELGLASYGEAEMLTLLRAHGFQAERLPWNVGFNRRRMTFRARPAQP